jgi:flagellar biosynthesis/type III secretory pathway chaperone
LQAKASPKKIFDTLCFVAGTHSVLEARNLANQQIAQSEQQLVAVIRVIKKLEEGIESERHILQLMNEKDEVDVALIDAGRGKELGEKVYEVVKKYASIIAAVAITKELTHQKDEEKELVRCLNCKVNFDSEMEDDSCLDPGGADSVNVTLTTSLRNRGSRINVDLQKCRAANVKAGEAVSDALSSMSQKNKTVRQLRAESSEQMQLINETKVRLKGSVLDAAARDEAHSLINGVSLESAIFIHRSNIINS